MPTGKKPNIVFILADDLGYHDLGCYGQELIETPTIDRLAQEGMRFTDFYAGSPVCAPSRATLMTGQHTGHTRVRANYARAGGLRKPPGSRGDPGPRRVGLTSADTTIADVLSRVGYKTALFGKWHLSGYSPANLPINRGFDIFHGSSVADGASYRPNWEFQQDRVMPVESEYRADYGDDTVIHHAVDFIRKNADSTFFLFIGLSALHKPFDIPDQGRYKNKPWNEMARNYAAMVTRLDEHVGRVLEALREQGLEDNTLVVFGSDNGGEYREYPEDWAQWTRLFQSNYPLRGGKADMYEGGIRVPMIMKWPGHIREGEVNTQPWYFPDFMAFFSDLAGANPPGNMDGISLLPAVTKGIDPGPRHMYWEFDHHGMMQAARWKEWKLIRWTERRKRIYGQAEMNEARRSEQYPFLELYNLEKDIGEAQNVVEQHPEIVERLIQYMDTARTPSKYWPLTPTEQKRMHDTQLQ